MARPGRLVGTPLLVVSLAACRDSSTMSGSPVGTADLAVTSSQSTRSHFVGNGVDGGLSWYSSDPNGNYIFGSLSVFTGAADTFSTASKAFLSYYEARCDAYSNCTYSYGYGLIRAAGVQSTGLSATALHLSTNTSGNPDFFATTPGIVTVDWNGNGVWSSSSKGINTYTSPGFTQMQEGTSRTASATATGTIVGVPIPVGAEGTIGSSHNLLITVTN